MSEGTEAACSHGLIQTNQSDPTPTQPAVIPALLHKHPCFLKFGNSLFIFFIFTPSLTLYSFSVCGHITGWLDCDVMTNPLRFL